MSESTEETIIAVIETNERSLRKRSRSSDSTEPVKAKRIKKNKNNPEEFKNEKEAEKFYMKAKTNKSVRVKSVLLETIFEEDESLQEEKLGKAKKRAMNICNGFDISKTLINKRKNQIMKKLGKRKKPKKVALKTFMAEFQKKIDEAPSECDLVDNSN